MLKNILYINLTANMSGAEFSLLSLMAGLDRKKFRPILLLPEPGPFLDKARTHGIETLILPSLIKFGEYFRFWKIQKIFRSVLWLKKIISEKKIHLVHCNSPRASYVGGLAALFCGVPCLTHVRDIQQSPFVSPLKSRLLGYLSQQIVAVSKATADAILQVNPSLCSKTTVVYNGIDLVAFIADPRKTIRDELGISSTARLIGAIGIIHPNKGQDILIKATAILKYSFPELTLLLIGAASCQEDPYKITLEKLAEELGIKGNVIFTGFRQDVLGVLQELDVVVHPAIFPDPLPRILLEAAAQGKAIVATRVGGVCEIIEDNVSGILVESGNAEALAGAVMALLMNPEETGRLSRAARKKIESHFSIKMHLAKITAIYELLWKLY
jgi:glycosyltransferase involved in cell wall biosynthesis